MSYYDISVGSGHAILCHTPERGQSSCCSAACIPARILLARLPVHDMSSFGSAVFSSVLADVFMLAYMDASAFVKSLQPLPTQRTHIRAVYLLGPNSHHLQHVFAAPLFLIYHRLLMVSRWDVPMNPPTLLLNCNLYCLSRSCRVCFHCCWSRWQPIGQTIWMLHCILHHLLHSLGACLCCCRPWWQFTR